jgi:GNAT superfamily N-acetyltransferase
VDGHPAVAFRQLGEDACEAKRLFVHPPYRRRGIARSLPAALVKEARRSGYRSLFGDTLPRMVSAMDLYRESGVVETGPYSESPTPDAIYLRLSL